MRKCSVAPSPRRHLDASARVGPHTVVRRPALLTFDVRLPAPAPWRRLASGASRHRPPCGRSTTQRPPACRTRALGAARAASQRRRAPRGKSEPPAERARLPKREHTSLVRIVESCRISRSRLSVPRHSRSGSRACAGPGISTDGPAGMIHPRSDTRRPGTEHVAWVSC